MAKYSDNQPLRAYKQGDGTRWGITDQPEGKPLVGNDIANLPATHDNSAEKFAELFAASPAILDIIKRFVYEFSDEDGFDRAGTYGLDGLLFEARAIVDELS